MRALVFILLTLPAQAHAWEGPVSDFLAQTPAERRRNLARQASDQR